MRPLDDDPLEADRFLLLLEQLRYPTITYGRLTIGGRDMWEDVARRAIRLERAQLLRRLRRHLLTLTRPGRRRLREYLTVRRGHAIEVETSIARRRRVATELKFYGDASVMPSVVIAIAELPRPVERFVLDAVMVIVVGRETNAWTAGRFPPRLPIVVAGHRTDAEIAATVRHEVAHRWLEEDQQAVPTAAEHVAIHERYRRQIGSKDADLLLSGLTAWSELGARACAIAWE